MAIISVSSFSLEDAKKIIKNSIYNAWIGFEPIGKSPVRYLKNIPGLVVNCIDYDPASFPTGIFQKGNLPDQKIAKTICTFLDQIHKEVIPYKLAVHCTAGVSRSGAVSSYVFSKYLTMSFEEWESTNYQCSANEYLLGFLMKEGGL